MCDTPFPISKNIPVSTPNRSGAKKLSGKRPHFPWGSLEAGDSFFVGTDHYPDHNPSAGTVKISNTIKGRVEQPSKRHERYVVRSRTAEQEAADGQPARKGWRVWRIR